jgi:glycosyltransferase involved in cell wall biosynthesis
MDASIIIPVFNTEKYLNRCVDSVIAQQEVSIEIILVDDGSTDTSSQICDDYSHKYEYIHTLHITNSGPATAKNEGMKIAQGDYIALTDSDDAMKPINMMQISSAAIICKLTRREMSHTLSTLAKSSH